MGANLECVKTDKYKKEKPIKQRKIQVLTKKFITFKTTLCDKPVK